MDLYRILKPDEIIDRLKYAEKQCVKGYYYILIRPDVCDRIIELLKKQEVKTGHWIDTTNTIGFPRCECSECNSEAGAIWMKYCPNCGAKMEGR